MLTKVGAVGAAAIALALIGVPALASPLGPEGATGSPSPRVVDWDRLTETVESMLISRAQDGQPQSSPMNFGEGSSFLSR